MEFPLVLLGLLGALAAAWHLGWLPLQKVSDTFLSGLLFGMAASGRWDWLRGYFRRREQTEAEVAGPAPPAKQDARVELAVPHMWQLSRRMLAQLALSAQKASWLLPVLSAPPSVPEIFSVDSMSQSLDWHLRSNWFKRALAVSRLRYTFTLLELWEDPWGRRRPEPVLQKPAVERFLANSLETLAALSEQASRGEQQVISLVPGGRSSGLVSRLIGDLLAVHANPAAGGATRPDLSRFGSLTSVQESIEFFRHPGGDPSSAIAKTLASFSVGLQHARDSAAWIPQLIQLLQARLPGRYLDTLLQRAMQGGLQVLAHERLLDIWKVWRQASQLSTREALPLGDPLHGAIRRLEDALQGGRPMKLEELTRLSSDVMRRDGGRAPAQAERIRDEASPSAPLVSDVPPPPAAWLPRLLPAFNPANLLTIVSYCDRLLPAADRHVASSPSQSRPQASQPLVPRSSGAQRASISPDLLIILGVVGAIAFAWYFGWFPLQKVSDTFLSGLIFGMAASLSWWGRLRRWFRRSEPPVRPASVGRQGLFNRRLLLKGGGALQTLSQPTPPAEASPTMLRLFGEAMEALEVLTRQLQSANRAGQSGFVPYATVSEAMPEFLRTHSEQLQRAWALSRARATVERFEQAHVAAIDPVGFALAAWDRHAAGLPSQSAIAQLGPFPARLDAAKTAYGRVVSAYEGREAVRHHPGAAKILPGLREAVKQPAAYEIRRVVQQLGDFLRWGGGDTFFDTDREAAAALQAVHDGRPFALHLPRRLQELLLQYVQGEAATADRALQGLGTSLEAWPTRTALFSPETWAFRDPATMQLLAPRDVLARMIKQLGGGSGWSWTLREPIYLQAQKRREARFAAIEQDLTGRLEAAVPLPTDRAELARHVPLQGSQWLRNPAGYPQHVHAARVRRYLQMLVGRRADLKPRARRALHVLIHRPPADALWDAHPAHLFAGLMRTLESQRGPSRIAVSAPPPQSRLVYGQLLFLIGRGVQERLLRLLSVGGATRDAPHSLGGWVALTAIVFLTVSHVFSWQQGLAIAAAFWLLQVFVHEFLGHWIVAAPDVKWQATTWLNLLRLRGPPPAQPTPWNFLRAPLLSALAGFLYIALTPAPILSAFLVSPGLWLLVAALVDRAPFLAGSDAVLANRGRLHPVVAWLGSLPRPGLPTSSTRALLWWILAAGALPAPILLVAAEAAPLRAFTTQHWYGTVAVGSALITVSLMVAGWVSHPLQAWSVSRRLLTRNVVLWMLGCSTVCIVLFVSVLYPTPKGIVTPVLNVLLSRVLWPMGVSLVVIGGVGTVCAFLGGALARYALKPREPWAHAVRAFPALSLASRAVLRSMLTTHAGRGATVEELDALMRRGRGHLTALEALDRALGLPPVGVELHLYPVRERSARRAIARTAYDLASGLGLHALDPIEPTLQAHLDVRLLPGYPSTFPRLLTLMTSSPAVAGLRSIAGHYTFGLDDGGVLATLALACFYGDPV